MAKKLNPEVKTPDTSENQTQTPAKVVQTPASILEKQMLAYPRVSIRKLANAHNLSYGKLLKASTAPVAGEPYNPDATNWAAVAEILGVDRILDTRWEALNQETNTGSKATLAKDMSAFKVGDTVYLRRDNETPFTIVHITSTHVVIQQVDTETPYAWSHGTFLINGPSATKRTQTNKKEAAAE